MATAYIKRDEALSFPWANGKYDHENANEHFIYGLETYKEWLEQLPTVSPDEVRGVGKWETWEDYYGSNVYKCSVCGADWDMIDGTPEDNDMNYCPNCGAKMEVSDDV